MKKLVFSMLLQEFLVENKVGWHNKKELHKIQKLHRHRSKQQSEEITCRMGKNFFCLLLRVLIFGKKASKMNTHFSDEVQIANKYLKNCSTFLPNGQMQIGTVSLFQKDYISLRTQKKEK